MELYVIRHGEPERTESPVDRADPPLSQRGLCQARALAGYFDNCRFDALYTSPQLRARQTATVLAQRLGTTPIVRDDLAEFDREAPEYLHFEDLVANNDPRYDAFLADDLSPWGTDADSFRNRVTTEMESIIAAHPSRRVAVVSHGGVANAFLGTVIGVSQLVFHYPSYTAFARVRASRAGRCQLISVNETPHLHGLD